MSKSIITIDNDYTCNSDYTIIMCDCSTNNIIVTLPDVVFMNTYYIEVGRCDISANSNILTVVSLSGQNINYTLSSYVLSNNENKCFQSDGNRWFLL